MSSNKWLLSLAAAVPALMCSYSASSSEAAEGDAGTSAGATGISEVIVTARRREENDLKVPVAIAVLSGADLDRRGITNFRDIGTATPGLIVADSQNFGGVVALRGIGAANTNTTADQSVLFTIDGVSLSNANAIRFSQFDMERVEVLKGPQALFYGKNATAGIISVNTANPTETPFARARLGYDFNARGLLSEAVVSGPLTDQIGARLAFFRESQDGLFTVPNSAGAVGPLGEVIAPPTYNRMQDYRLMGFRGTLTFKETELFSLKGKFSYATRRGASPFGGAQLFYCPLGGPNPNDPAYIGSNENCKVDTVAAAQSPGPTRAQVPTDWVLGDGRDYYDASQYLDSIDAALKVTDALTVNSTTSYYKFADKGFGNTTMSAANMIAVGTDQYKIDYTQELRLTSDWADSPVNFMIGGYFQRGNFNQAIPLAIFYAQFDGTKYDVHSQTDAGFGQLTFDITHQLHLTAGGRYTFERKTLKAFDTVTTAQRPIAAPDNQLDSSSFSPEVNLTYEPVERSEVYLSYRKGTKSGAFNTNPTTSVLSNLRYQDETVQGVEGGVKSVIDDGQLRLDLSAYRYEYRDLQLGFFDGVTLQVTTANAGGAISKGAELSATFAPKVAAGFTLTGNVSYNDARFRDNALGSCYNGQGVAQGCNLTPVNGLFTNQSFAGKRLARAPELSGALTGGYEHPLGPRLKGGISVTADYKGRFNPVTELAPFLEQASALTLDVSLHLATLNDQWDLQLIGKNLTQVLRIQNGYSVPLSPDPAGATALTGTPLGGTPSDYFGYTNDPRSIELRATYEFPGT